MFFLFLLTIIFTVGTQQTQQSHVNVIIPHKKVFQPHSSIFLSLFGDGAQNKTGTLHSLLSSNSHFFMVQLLCVARHTKGNKSKHCPVIFWLWYHLQLKSTFALKVCCHFVKTDFFFFCLGE